MPKGRKVIYLNQFDSETFLELRRKQRKQKQKDIIDNVEKLTGSVENN